MRNALAIFIFLVGITTYANSNNASINLQNCFIWSNAYNINGSFTVFRKSFEATIPDTAIVSIFADARFILWINGQEVLRGPCRFDPKAPQYDYMNVTSYIKKGKNTVAVLVMAHGSNGKMMDHEPGLTLSLLLKDSIATSEIITDETWLWNNQTRFLPAVQNWGFTCDRVDARLDIDDWTYQTYNDVNWKHAVKINGNKWGSLTARSIPLLSKTAISLNTINRTPFPLIVQSSTIIELKQMIQGFAEFEFEANAGSTLVFDFGYTTDSVNVNEVYRATNIYIAKQGRQRYTTTDTYGFRYIKITTLNEPIKLLGVKAFDNSFPFINAGNFWCNDNFLNTIWQKSVNTIKMNAQDGYMDCALREKAEWMGDAAVVEYPVSRVVFGCINDFGIVKSDASLMKNMIRHIAQSQTDSGTLKAHHPSDRISAHAYIEDYSCLWVQSLRQVYDNTLDTELVKEVWEPLKRQMNWFLNHRTSNMLLLAREFVNIDNPIAYVSCEGATLNSFFYKSLIDAAYLAVIIGDKEMSRIYSDAATDLHKAFNHKLWIPEKQTYAAGMSDNKVLFPTVHAALLAQQMGIVPNYRLKPVNDYILANYNNYWNKVDVVENDKTKGKYSFRFLKTAFDINNKPEGINMTYTAFWLLNYFFENNYDSLALSYIHDNWAALNANTQTKTLPEKFGGTGDLCHNYGAVPAYFLSTKVLGITVLLPLDAKTILIKPQLGALTEAKGAVVTEHGVVLAEWVKSGKNFDFVLKIPKGITAKVNLPEPINTESIIINGCKVNFKKKNNYIYFELKSGEFKGSIKAL